MKRSHFPRSAGAVPAIDWRDHKKGTARDKCGVMAAPHRSSFIFALPGGHEECNQNRKRARFRRMKTKHDPGPQPPGFKPPAHGLLDIAGDPASPFAWSSP